MLLESAYKIAAKILHARLLPIAENLDRESQCGYRQGRSCSDAIFSVKVVVQKRKEHDMETWVLFLDLVKAFDRVPRELLWQVLDKSGVPPKLLRILKSLHQEVTINFEVAGYNKSLNNTVGVKQGDTLGPLLFLFYIAAILKSWRLTTTTAPCVFMSNPDFIISGRNHLSQGDIFMFRDSAYTDDTVVAFINRENTELGVNQLISHFSRFGMQIHTGTARKNSKSEIVFFPRAKRSYSDPSMHDNTDQSAILCSNNSHIPVVSKFRYLGSFLDSSTKDHLDVSERIKAASSAFGTIRKQIFRNRNIGLIGKSLVYKTAILPIALYGSQTWTMTAADEQLLSVFHNNCIRTISRVTRRIQRRNRISTRQLLSSVDLPDISILYTRNQLRWAGHMARMDYSRLPRKFLSSWCPNPRLRGAPSAIYGRSLQHALRKANIDLDTWFTQAQNRTTWRGLVQNSHQ